MNMNTIEEEIAYYFQIVKSDQCVYLQYIGIKIEK